MIIDFHTHIFPPQIREKRSDYLKCDPCFAELYSSPKAKLATAEELITSMDEAGIDASVVVNIAWISQRLCVESNDYILEAVSHYPERLIGFCAIQPRAGEEAIAELERCAQSGAKGIGELRVDLREVEIIKPFSEIASKYNLILLTHASEPVGHHYQGKGNITPDILYQFISNFPDLIIVCAHWGGGLPFYALMPEVASALSNTFFDTAASPLLYRPQIFKHATEIVGADKILLGSDYPLIKQSRMRREVESAELPQEAKALILGGNAQRILGWSKSAPLSPLNCPRK
jgi:hypothetical protein